MREWVHIHVKIPDPQVCKFHPCITCIDEESQFFFPEKKKTFKSKSRFKKSEPEHLQNSQHALVFLEFASCSLGSKAWGHAGPMPEPDSVTFRPPFNLVLAQCSLNA
jgi:hypothetical protein